jgi:hypothetical protein
VPEFEVSLPSSSLCDLGKIGDVFASGVFFSSEECLAGSLERVFSRRWIFPYHYKSPKSGIHMNTVNLSAPDSAFTLGQLKHFWEADYRVNTALSIQIGLELLFSPSLLRGSK